MPRNEGTILALRSWFLAVLLPGVANWGTSKSRRRVIAAHDADVQALADCELPSSCSKPINFARLKITCRRTTCD